MTDRAARRDAAENREAIIAAARSVLTRDRDAPIETIAAAAGLTRRAVYGHFPSRDHLVREVVHLGAARIAAAMPTASDLNDMAPADQLATIAVALWAEVSDVRSVAQLAVRSPLSAAVIEAFGPVRALVRDACAQGVADGTFRNDLDTETLARLVEGACFAVLDEATRPDASQEITASVVIVSALGMAGVDWHTSERAIPNTTRTGTA